MVCPYSLSIPGGVQAQVMGLSRVLRDMGIEVRVLAPCDGPPPATFVTPLGNSLPTAANGSIAPLAPDPACQLRMIRALTDEEFDVIHLHEPFLPGPCQTAVLLRTAPMIGTFHSAGESAAYKYLRGPVERAAEQPRPSRRGVEGRRASWSTATSAASTRSSSTASSSTTTASRRRADSPGPTIFFCARHEERKGLDVLLRRDAAPPGRRHAVGRRAAGPTRSALTAEFAHDPRIVWLGRLTDEDKIAYLKGADVFCAPSLHGESFGVVLIEAMAAGTAIVASSLDGYRNVATDGVDSVLVDPGDAEALAKALAEVLANPRLRQRLVAAGRRPRRSTSR